MFFFLTKLWRCVCGLDRARSSNQATAAANSNRIVNSNNGSRETRSSCKIEKEWSSCLAITLSCVPRYRPINKWGNWTCLIISVDLRVILETFSMDSWVCLLASRLTTWSRIFTGFFFFILAHWKFLNMSAPFSSQKWLFNPGASTGMSHQGDAQGSRHCYWFVNCEIPLSCNPNHRHNAPHCASWPWNAQEKPRRLLLPPAFPREMPRFPIFNATASLASVLACFLKAHS